MSRELRLLPVSTGLDALPELERALGGQGPALLPVSAREPEVARRVADALGAGEGLDEAPDTALVVATSGSTGPPKGVLLTASALRASATATHERLGGPGHWLLALPAHHVAGVQVLVRSLVAGTTPAEIDSAGGFRAGQFAEATRRMHGSRRYTALVPTQLARLLDDDEGLRTLQEFDAVLLGGAATPPALLENARMSGVRVVTTYGMSETCGGCVYDGVPLDGVQVRLDGGVISLAGPVLASGYRRYDSDAFSGDWFRTGDLGRWRDGRLEVVGRADDVIITGGVNVAPGPVERILSEHPGVREVCVVGVADPEWGQVVTAAVVAADPAPDADELRSAVREHLGAAAAPKRVVFVPELPLRGPGKHDRRALRDQLAAL